MEFSPFKAFLPDEQHLESTPIDNPNLFKASHFKDWSYANIVNSQNPSIKLDMFVQKGWYKQGLMPKLWLYSQQFEEHTFTGVIGLASIYDLHKGIIKPHEKTLPEREMIFTDYLNHNPVHAEPVCLSANSKALEKFNKEVSKKEATYSFQKNGITHQLWELENNEIKELLSITGDLEEVYIADGHHRTASSAIYFSENNENPSAKYFLSFLVPSADLVIKPFHREILVSDSEKLRVEDFVSEKHFLEIVNLPPNLYKNEIVIELDGRKYLKKVGLFGEETPYGYINNNILGPILNIHDLKHSKRVKFFPGNKTLPEFAAEKTKPNQMRIYLPALSFETIKHYSDNKLDLPPKSSWILPKMLTGLTLFDIRNH